MGSRKEALFCEVLIVAEASVEFLAFAASERATRLAAMLCKAGYCATDGEIRVEVYPRGYKDLPLVRFAWRCQKEPDDRCEIESDLNGKAHARAHREWIENVCAAVVEEYHAFRAQREKPRRRA